MAKKSLIDEFVQGVGNGINDIREKAVEEAYFGRPVTDNIQPSAEVASHEPSAATPGTEWQDYVKESREPAQHDEMPDHDPGFDR